MDRRDFLNMSALGLAGLAFPAGTLFAKSHDSKAYNVVILGDTHFDT